MFESLISKVLLATTLLFLATSSLTTWAYLDIKDDLTTLRTQHKQLEEDFKNCEKSKEKVKASEKQDDALDVSKQVEVNKLRDKNTDLQKRLENLPKKVCQTKVAENKNETEYVDIDAPFDPEFIRVLDQLSKRDSGSTNTPKR